MERVEMKAGDEYTLQEVWGPIRAVLFGLTFSQIKLFVSKAGLDMTKLSHLSQNPPRPTSKDALLSAVDGALDELEKSKQERFVRSVLEQLAAHTEEAVEEIKDDLRGMGWSFSKGKLLPLSLIDELDKEVIPPESLGDLVRAAQRLRDGDLSGALTAACGVVESACAEVYARYKLGKPDRAAFQEKVSTSLDVSDALTTIERELIKLGWTKDDSRRIKENLKGSINQAAYVMQKLRSDMADVHGSKKVYVPIVYDSLKWASIIVSLFPKP